MTRGESSSTFEIENPSHVHPKSTQEEATDDDEFAILRESDQDVWIRYARCVSYISITFTLVGGILGIVFYAITDSVSLLGYGLESFVDVWSSILVLWRFWGKDVDGHHKQTAFNKREIRASFGIAFTFVMIGLFVSGQAVAHIVDDEKEEDAELLLILAGISAVFLIILAAIKFRISYELNSGSLYKDGMSSVAVACLSCGILLSTVVYDVDSDVWWLDDVVALLISAFLIIYGFISMYMNRNCCFF